jgi:hypothetical protein
VLPLTVEAAPSTTVEVSSGVLALVGPRHSLSQEQAIAPEIGRQCQGDLDDDQ